MARIRTIKPEMFESEDIASVSVTAVLTFVGLLTQADDQGRHRAHAAIIAGRLWALRQEHTPAHVAQDLEELAAVGLICRYTGCDGRTYLHIVAWEKHQRIDRPSASRLPRCPQHQVGHKCAEHAAEPCPAPRPAAAPTTGAVPSRIPSGTDSASRRGLDRADSPGSPPTETSGGDARRAVPPASAPDLDRQEAPVDASDETAGQAAFVEGSPHPREGSSSGSRILDPGSSRRGREAPALDAALEQVSAKELVAEYVNGCQQRPPGNFVGQLGRNLKALLDEGFTPEHIRPALDRLRAKALHPSVLASLVNEVVNPPLVGAGAPSASGGGPWTSTGHQPYMNPNAPEPTTFGRSL
ncbi:hypothetical protein [Streptomyces jumonjinensis]|uniref:hypothetical protein n=1 Tax=Streptomyces jumonjinensis TaxID=1945 RepID=UPI0037879E31